MKDRFLHSSAFELLSRGGFVARGIVCGLIGVLAVAPALGAGGKATNQQGALGTVAHLHFGRVLLVLVAAGLGGYVAAGLVAFGAYSVLDARYHRL